MESSIEGFENLSKFHVLKIQMVNSFDSEKGSWYGCADMYDLLGAIPKDPINDFIYKNINEIVGESNKDDSYDKEDMVICFKVKNDPNDFIRYYFTFVSQTQKSFSDGYLPREHEVYRFIDLDFNDFPIEEKN